MIYRNPKKIVSIFSESRKSSIPALAACSDGDEELFVLHIQLVSIPALGLLECATPVLRLEVRIVPQSLDHGHPGSDFLRGRHHAARRRASIGNREHESGIARSLRRCARPAGVVSVKLCCTGKAFRYQFQPGAG
jgi:hypothetical protein